MKSFIILLIGLVLVTGCSNERSSQIPGTYVNHGKSEYSVACDTLIISEVVNGKTYQVEDRTGFQRITNGILLKKEFKTEKWQASWNPNTRVLSETEFGRQLYFNQNGKSIAIKNTNYTRIK